MPVYPYILTPRLKIPTPDEREQPDVPAVWSARAAILDNLAHVGTGPLTSRPASTPSTPGVSGNLYVTTDQADSPRLDADYGSGWMTVGPAPADGAPNVPSRRTLGTGAQQACAGNDPRLVGGATASGDLSGTYPGPMTLQTWNGQTKAQVVASAPPQPHALTHRTGSSDAITGLTDAAMAAPNIDGAAGTASLRTLGQGAQQAMAGNDPRIAGGSTHVAGDLIVSAAATRAGCLLCDGSAVNRSTYAALFAAIGTAYGSGDGSSTFNVPDYRGRTIVGAGAGPGLTGWSRGNQYGSENQTHNVPNLTLFASTAQHSHPLSGNGGAQVNGFDSGGTNYLDFTIGGPLNSFPANRRLAGIPATYSTISGSGVAPAPLQGNTDQNNAQVSGVAVGAPTDSQSILQPMTVANVFIKT